MHCVDQIGQTFREVTEVGSKIEQRIKCASNPYLAHATTDKIGCWAMVSTGDEIVLWLVSKKTTVTA